MWTIKIVPSRKSGGQCERAESEVGDRSLAPTGRSSRTLTAGLEANILS